MCSKRLLLQESLLKGFLLITQVKCHAHYYTVNRTMKKYETKSPLSSLTFPLIQVTDRPKNQRRNSTASPMSCPPLPWCQGHSERGSWQSIGSMYVSFLMSEKTACLVDCSSISSFPFCVRLTLTCPVELTCHHVTCAGPLNVSGSFGDSSGITLKSQRTHFHVFFFLCYNYQ